MTSIRYIVRYTKIISKDRGNGKKLLPRVSSSRALPPVPLPLVLDIAPDLTLVKSTSDPYLSSSNLVPFTSLVPAFPPSSL